MFRKDIRNGLDKLAVPYKSAAFCKQKYQFFAKILTGTGFGPSGSRNGTAGKFCS
jgi:hypothetical protein